VNDGSTDNSFEELRKICLKDPRVKAINFKRNFGQTAAINAGIQHASGEILVLIDSDLENDPKDILTLLAKVNEGFDVVSGWRQERWKGSYLTRKVPSILANRLISYMSGVKLHDYGCTLKAYKKEVIKDVSLYGQMHRFIPVYCTWQGGKITEVPVTYSPRIYGKSNYGLFRTYKVVLDLIMIKFLDKYMTRPIHFFGGIGITAFLLSLGSGFLSLYLKIIGYATLIQTPLPTISAVFFIIGVQMILMGVSAEIQMRTYFESQNKFPYSIKEKINLNV
jgi:glycosyltransferase involved in cell wall biosynthesis